MGEQAQRIKKTGVIPGLQLLKKTGECTSRGLLLGMCITDLRA